MVVATSEAHMMSYRGLVNGLHKRAAIPVDVVLTTVSSLMKIFAFELPPQEVAILRRNLPVELRQLLVAQRTPFVDRRHRNHEGRPIVEMLASSLNISTAEAKKRILILLAEMREGTTPWGDVTFLETIDRIVGQIDSVPAQAVVA